MDFSAISPFLELATDTGVILVFAGLFWKTIKRKDCELKRLHEKLIAITEAQTAATTRVESALVALKDAIRTMR